MIISCPSCGASFNVLPEALGTSGRTVKCSKCAYRWRVLPDGTTAEEQPAAADLAAQAAAPASAPSAPAASEIPEPESPAEQADADEHAAESEESSEAPDAAPIPSFRLRDALGDAPSEDAARDDETPPPGGRRRPRGAARKPRGGVAKVISLFVLILLISGVVSVATLMRQEVMIWLPATQRLYALAGVEPNFLGRGLQIIEPMPKKEIDGNDQILVVEGEVRNTTSGAIDVPLMRGALLDGKGKALHVWTFTAAKSRIAPGETARYRTEFRNPPSEAESLDITFTQTDIRMEAATQQADAPGGGAPAVPLK